MSSREAVRQQLLLRAIVSRGDGLALNGWVRESGARMGRGLAAYQANLGAAAERALAGTFPTVQQRRRRTGCRSRPTSSNSTRPSSPVRSGPRSSAAGRSTSSTTAWSRSIRWAT
jgi:hypothetical protein